MAERYDLSVLVILKIPVGTSTKLSPERFLDSYNFFDKYGNPEKQLSSPSLGYVTPVRPFTYVFYVL